MLTVDAIALFLADRRARNCQPRTIDYYAGELARITRATRELPTTAFPLKLILASIDGAPATRHATFRAFRAFYRQLAKDSLVDPNPMLLVAPPNVKKKYQRTLDRPQVADLLALDLSPRDRAIVILILDSGVRSGELRSLRGEDLHEDPGDNYIEVTGKTSEGHRVPIHPDTMAQLRALAAGSKDPVFRTVEGKPLTRNRVYLIVRRALEKSGLDRSEKNGPHMLRHSFGRGWVANHGPLPALQRILGHAQITTTMVYVDLAVEEVSSIHAEFSQLTAKKPAIHRVK